MILSKYDIERKKAELEKLGRDYPVQTGFPTEYFFTFKTNEGEEDGVCGLPCVILDMRPGDDPNTDVFYADLAISTSVDDFYVEQLNIPVLGINVYNEQDVKSVSLCHAPDVEVISLTVNTKFRVDTKTHLKLVVDNLPKKE